MGLFTKKVTYDEFCQGIFDAWSEILDKRDYLHEHIQADFDYKLTNTENDHLWINLEYFLLQMTTANSVYHFDYTYTADDIMERVNQNYSAWLIGRGWSSTAIKDLADKMDDYYDVYLSKLKKAYEDRGLTANMETSDSEIMTMHAEVFSDIYQPDDRTNDEKRHNIQTRSSDMDEIAYKFATSVISLVRKEFGRNPKITW